MKNAAFIVAIETYLVRAGLVSMLNGIPGIRVIREFDSPEALLHFTRFEPGHFLIISRSLFDRSEALFLAQPGLLEKTILLDAHAKPSAQKGGTKAIGLSDSRETILKRILEIIRPYGEAASGHREEPLTERERTIVRLVSLGLTNRQIAEQLYLSTHTVITHRKNISSKLGIKSVSGLTVYAIVNNIITIEEVTSNP